MKLFNVAVSCLILATNLFAETSQKDIEPVFVQLEQNGKEFPMLAEKDGVKYQVYRAASEGDDQNRYYFADKNGERYWVTENGSQNFTVGYLDGDNKLVSLDKATEKMRTHLAALAKQGKISEETATKSQLVRWWRRWGYNCGYYPYRGYYYGGYRSYGSYYYNSYYYNNVVAYQNCYPYNYYGYNSYYYNAAPVYYSSYAYYGPRYTVCLWG